MSPTPSDWRERIKSCFVQDIGEGEMRPRFFLPTSRNYNRNSYRAWVMPLAPFVLLFNALQNGFNAFWYDLCSQVSEWKHKLDQLD